MPSGPGRLMSSPLAASTLNVETSLSITAVWIGFIGSILGALPRWPSVWRSVMVAIEQLAGVRLLRQQIDEFLGEASNEPGKLQGRIVALAAVGIGAVIQQQPDHRSVRICAPPLHNSHPQRRGAPS